jgi:hypothetical protein
MSLRTCTLHTWLVLTTTAVVIAFVPALPADAQPSLDDLLGLEDPVDTDTESDPRPSVDDILTGTDRPDATDDPTRAELERALDATPPSDDVSNAALKMADAAAQLEAGRTGTETQRLQEDVIRLLDQAIEKAKQQQQSSSKSQSSSSSSSSSGEQPQTSQSSQQSQSSSAQQSGATGSEGDGGTDLPGAQDAELAERLEASRAAWGALPQRTRDALLQGSSDRFSSLYRRLTEDYYRRLAEDTR